MSEAPPEPWGIRDVPLADPVRWTIGPLAMLACGYANELRLKTMSRIPTGSCVIREGELNPPAGDDPLRDVATGLDDTLDWLRFAVGDRVSRVRMVPTMPDRPVVVGAEAAYQVHAGSEARVFVRIPVWVRLETVESKPVVLAELPTVPLSSTWFGNLSEGELCYWAPSRLRRGAKTTALKPHVALVPVQIQNTSTEILQLSTLALRVEHLSLFSQDGFLWSDETRISYQGGGEYTKLKWSGGPPQEAADAKLVSGPRTPMKTGLSAWTFARLKDLSILGAR